MDELNNLLSFSWRGTKRDRYTTDKWGEDKNCRPLKDSETKANALLTGYRQLDKTRQWKLVAIDLDNKDNFELVLETYRALDLPQSLTVATPSGGFHIFFWVNKSTPAQTISDDRHIRNLEVKADNSNITAPLSVFDCGAEYKVVRDLPIVRLLPGEAYRLCKRKQEVRVTRTAEDFVPERAEVDNMALKLDDRARRNPRGWQIRCPYHEDTRSSAVLFDSGWIYCSGCGEKQMVVK